MKREKIAIVNSFSTRRGKASGCMRGRFSCFCSKLQSGFSMVELLMLLAVIGIVGGFAAFSIGRGVIPGMRANQAMSQVVASLREARMLAMNHDTLVSLQFALGGNQITAQILNSPIAVANWMNIPDYAVARGIRVYTDPSSVLVSNYQFSRNGNLNPPNGSALGDVVLGTDTTTGRAVFNEDGFLTNGVDLDNPINGTIYIGTPDANPDLARAITIRGATGDFTAWQWRKGRWEKAR